MGMESFSSASDLHGDRQDAGAVKAFKAFVADYKPKVRVFTGDIWDFRAIREGASKDEKRHSMRADFYAGMKFLEWYRPHVITLGNHDQRLWDLVSKEGIEKSGPLTDLAAELIEKFDKLTTKLGTEVLPYDKRRGVWRHNGLKFAHGFDGMSPDNMAAIYGNIIYGHGHAIEMAPAPTDEGHRVARMVGCLCRLDMSYNRAQTKTLRQQHGWAYGAFLQRGVNEVFQASVQHGQVAYAGSLKVISA
jgi:hypothetical protein